MLAEAMTPEFRAYALLLLVVALGLVLMLLVFALFGSWRQHNQREDWLESRRRRRRGKPALIDVWSFGARKSAAEDEAQALLRQGDDSVLDGLTDGEVAPAPPAFDTGNTYDDGYEDDEAEVDVGDEWKLGTEYEEDEDMEGPDGGEEGEDEPEDPDKSV